MLDHGLNGSKLRITAEEESFSALGPPVVRKISQSHPCHNHF